MIKIPKNKELLDLVGLLKPIFKNVHAKNKEILKKENKKSIFTYVSYALDNIRLVIAHYYYGDYEMFEEMLNKEIMLSKSLDKKRTEKDQIRDVINKIETGD